MRTTRPPPPPAAPAPNSRFGRFTLAERIAVGGMAEVFLATTPSPAGAERTVVVKRMLPSVAAEAGGRDMFAAEAGLGQLVRHPNVVEMIAFGEEDGQAYLVLEYVRGADLWRVRRWLKRAGRTLGIPLSLHVVVEMLKGLNALHEARDARGRPLAAVHRDVSPSNILVSIHGDVKLGDFGIAKARMRESFPQAPMSDRAKGKLGYLAPEQVSGLECDRRADVFAAGVVLAELLIGGPLFTGASELAVLLAIRDAKIGPLLEIMDRLPTGLGEVLVSALARRPEERLGSAEELARLLEPFQAEDERTLRRSLGALVAEVCAADSPPGGGTRERTTPIHRVDEDALDRSEAFFEQGRKTSPLQLDYMLKTRDGRILGPWHYAKVIEAIATGMVGPDDSVAHGGDEFQFIADMPDLLRHVPQTSLTPITSPEAPRSPDEEIALAGGGIAAALGRSAALRATGLWLCELGGVRKEIYVKDGAPEFVTSNLASELLGEYLVSRDVLTRGELDMALAVMPRFDGRLGETLTALGLVEPVHLFQYMAEQVREKLLDLFTWSGGTAGFYRGIPPPPSGFALDIDPWQLLDEGLRRRFVDELDGDVWMGALARRVAKASPMPEHMRDAPLPPRIRGVLASVARPTSIGQLPGASDDPTSAAPFVLQRVVLLLLHLGALVWVDR